MNDREHRARSSPRPPGWEIVEELLQRRVLWRARALAEPAPRVSSGLEALDRASGGGLPRGALTEVVVPAGGGATIACCAMRAAAARGDKSALVDPGSGFDPDSAAGLGVDLSRLLWLQPPDRGALLRGTELLLETGGFGLVVLDLVGEPKRPLSRIAWARLARRARESGSALLALTPRDQARQSAALMLRVTRARFRWRGKGRPYWDGVELQFAPVRRAAGVS